MFEKQNKTKVDVSAVRYNCTIKLVDYDFEDNCFGAYPIDMAYPYVLVKDGPADQEIHWCKHLAIDVDRTEAFNKALRKSVYNAIYSRISHSSDWKEWKLFQFDESYFMDFWGVILKVMFRHAKDLHMDPRNVSGNIYELRVNKAFAHWLNTFYLFELADLIDEIRNEQSEVWAKAQTYSKHLNDLLDELGDLAFKLLNDAQWGGFGVFHDDSRYQITQYINMAHKRR